MKRKCEMEEIEMLATKTPEMKMAVELNQLRAADSGSLSE
ncbi:hypothetical protein AGMMS50276_30830 [Synergistales bacterium]|nr:hypothetical protein AGMMS50276_30830 [Synergistales bacterium]